MSVFSDILVSKVSEEVLPDWTVRTLKVEKVLKLLWCIIKYIAQMWRYNIKQMGFKLLICKTCIIIHSFEKKKILHPE